MALKFQLLFFFQRNWIIRRDDKKSVYIKIRTAGESRGINVLRVADL